MLFNMGWSPLEEDTVVLLPGRWHFTPYLCLLSRIVLLVWNIMRFEWERAEAGIIPQKLE